MEVLLGLPVDGGPVIGKVESPDESANLCNWLLEIRPVEKVDRGGCKVKLKWLQTHFNGQLVEGYTEEQVRQQACGYILQLISGILMPDHSGSRVHLCYLSLFEDLTVVHSWGSACLSNIYHFLCNGC